MKRQLLKLTSRLLIKNEISFLSDSISDYKILEDFLEKEYRDSPEVIEQLKKDKDPEQQIKSSLQTAIRIGGYNPFKILIIFNSLIKKLNSITQLPTRYDSKKSYELISRIIPRLKEILPKDERENFPNFATIPNGNIGAMAINLSKIHNKFLLFDSHFFLYCHLFTKAFLGIFDWEESRRLKGILPINQSYFLNQILLDPDKTLFNFIDIINCYCVVENLAKTSPWWNSKIHESMLEDVRDEMELFVLAHEYSHVNLGHLQNSLGINSTNFESIEELDLNESQTKELDADLYGFILVTKIMEHENKLKGNPIRYMGIMLFFIASSILSKVQHLIIVENMNNYNGGGGESHPPFQYRKLNLISFIIDTTEDKEERNQILSLLRTLEDIEETLWVNLLPRFKAVLYEQRKWPHDKIFNEIEEEVQEAIDHMLKKKKEFTKEKVY